VMASGQAFVGRERPITIDREGRGISEEAFYTFIYTPFDTPNDGGCHHRARG
jgi:hypothetical protein